MASTPRLDAPESDISVRQLLLIVAVMSIAIIAFNWQLISVWISQVLMTGDVLKYPDQVSVRETTIARPVAPPPVWKEKPSEVISGSIPTELEAQNYKPITTVKTTSFNPTTQLPALPKGTKNEIPLAIISQSRGQVFYNDYATLYKPENTQDADWTTNWRTVTDLEGEPTYIEYQFLQPIQLQQLRFKADWDSKAGYDESISISFWIKNEALTEWQLVATQAVTKRTMGLGHMLSFTPQTATQLRVQYDDPDGKWGGWGNIYEVQAIGTR